MARPVMFLRTAQTEGRIDDLEKQVAWLKKYLKVPDEPTQSDEEWEAAKPTALTSPTGGGEDMPLPEPKPPQKAKKRA